MAIKLNVMVWPHKSASSLARMIGGPLGNFIILDICPTVWSGDSIVQIPAPEPILSLICVINNPLRVVTRPSLLLNEHERL